jgi:SulP family sulfate permease
VDRLRPFLPFLGWFPIKRETLRADFFAGITVGLILVPQSMAYAQLAGLPPYYGLYAAFLPVLIAALWGSSHQLATGPVAMVSLLTGAVLSKSLAPGSEQFIALAIVLALMVGMMQLTMGLFKLGAIVSFLSHPVIVGFTNAAAIIIALSQLDKVLGIASSRSENFLVDVWGMLRQIADTNLSPLLMAAAALAIMIAVRRFAPQWPGVLIAVVATTLVSWQTGYERTDIAPTGIIADSEVRIMASEYSANVSYAAYLKEKLAAASTELAALKEARNGPPQELLAHAYDVESLRLEIKEVERENRLRGNALRKYTFVRGFGAEFGGVRLYPVRDIPPRAETDGRRWRIGRIAHGQLELIGGGEVVGAIPSGLPSITVPALSWDRFASLLSAALVITLVGFMEALSIAKAMATRTRQRVDPNQELIGQGLANIVGSFSQSFPVSGSFSRSAVNFSAGAVTGMSSVFAWLLVLVTLLFFTPLLYHLPQAVLAAIIIMAVVNLVNFRAIRHAWQAHRHDGVAATVTFAATLGFAPHLDTGILTGAGLAIILYLYRTMRPRVAVLGRHPDGTLRDAHLHKLETSEHIIVIRFDGSLFFANVPYFEGVVLDQVARNPKAKFVLVVGDAINEIDGSGEEAIRQVVERLGDNRVTMVFSGLKYQVLRVLENTRLFEKIGAHNFFRTEEQALAAIYGRIDDPGFDAATCALRVRSPHSGTA